MSAVKERPASTGRRSPVVERKVQSPAASLTQKRAQPSYTAMAAQEFEAQDEIDSVVIRAIRTKQKRKRVKALLLLKVGLVFMLGLLVVFRYASITELGYKVSSAKNEYEQLSAENARLRVNIKSGMNLNELTSLAKEKFDMQPADQTEVYKIELAEERDDRAWYTKIYDSFREFLGLI